MADSHKEWTDPTTGITYIPLSSAKRKQLDGCKRLLHHYAGDNFENAWGEGAKEAAIALRKVLGHGQPDPPEEVASPTSETDNPMEKK